MEIYISLFIALKVLLTSPFSVAAADGSFGKFRLIKHFVDQQ